MSRKITHYRIVPVYEPEDRQLVIANASIGRCGLCGDAATGMGGTRDQLCTRCAEVVLSGEARDTITWEDVGYDD